MRFHRVLLIVNPVARTVSKPTLAVIEKALSADFRLEVSETKERGHANELAAQAVEEGIDLVVVFSGDGTINEAVNALAGNDTALGVIPGGATNILARALDLPTDPVEATGVLITKALDDEAARWPPGTEGLLFAPYLSGERTPHSDPAARGAFTGLSLRHDRGALARAEAGLALAGEDLPHRAPRCPFDQPVGVDERSPEHPCEPAADDRLAVQLELHRHRRRLRRAYAVHRRLLEIS